MLGKFGSVTNIFYIMEVVRCILRESYAYPIT